MGVIWSKLSPANVTWQHRVNITRFIKEELAIKPDDVLIVKMDIEGSEWGVLQGMTRISPVIEIIWEVWYRCVVTFNIIFFRLSSCRQII